MSNLQLCESQSLPPWPTNKACAWRYACVTVWVELVRGVVSRCVIEGIWLNNERVSCSLWVIVMSRNERPSLINSQSSIEHQLQQCLVQSRDNCDTVLCLSINKEFCDTSSRLLPIRLITYSWVLSKLSRISFRNWQWERAKWIKIAIEIRQLKGKL